MDHDCTSADFYVVSDIDSANDNCIGVNGNMVTDDRYISSFSVWSPTPERDTLIERAIFANCLTKNDRSVPMPDTKAFANLTGSDIQLKIIHWFDEYSAKLRKKSGFFSETIAKYVRKRF